MRIAAAVGVISCAGSPLYGQAIDRNSSIIDLPRKGYEPRAITLGATVIRPTLDIDATRDDNIFATRRDKVDDEILSVRPRITAVREGQTFDFNADAHGDFLRYRSNSRENVNSFGAAFNATTAIARSHALVAKLAFDRSFERRSDPEANTDRSRSPALINIAEANLLYRYDGNRLGFQAEAGVTQIDYLPAVDNKRDLLTMTARVRGSVRLRRFAVYVEPFINKRDFRLPSSRTGVFGATTVGALTGISFDLADKLQGNLGAGVFRSNPEGSQADSFTGLALSGRLTWHPRTRTALSLSLFRGDVATVRAGALGRVDTRVGFAIDQEARHNLILHAAAGLRKVQYRGSLKDQRYISGEGEARYLIDRHFAVVLAVAYTRRTSSFPDDKFNRFQSTLGLRMSY